MKITTNQAGKTTICGSAEDIIKLAEHTTKHTVSVVDLEEILLKVQQDCINNAAKAVAYGNKKSM